jgi:trans-AT polyketide synthase, acyltransferase and oxidoreductase domains
MSCGALAEADVDDTVMAPSADMFEQGARVQVLRRGTFFPGRAQRLSMLYQSHHSIDDLAPAARERLERDVFRCSLPEAWAATEHYWSERDPDQLRRAATDPHHRMALLFRSYLGQTSGWAITGNPTRSTDYQIWCGPAVGAFNRWAVTGPLSRPGERSVVRIGQALMAKATALTRLHQLTACGVRATPQCRTVVARPPA